MWHKTEKTEDGDAGKMVWRPKPAPEQGAPAKPPAEEAPAEDDDDFSVHVFLRRYDHDNDGQISLAEVE